MKTRKHKTYTIRIKKRALRNLLMGHMCSEIAVEKVIRKLLGGR